MEPADHHPPPPKRSAGATIAFPKPPRVKTDLLIPEGGIAIFLLDTSNPIAVYAIDEFILGRANRRVA